MAIDRTKVSSPGSPTNHIDFYGRPIHCGGLLIYVANYVDDAIILKVMFVDGEWAADRLNGTPDSWLVGAEDCMILIQKYDGANPNG